MDFSTDYNTFLAYVNTSSDVNKFDNSTTEDDPSRKELKFILDILLLLSLLLIMLGIGTEIAWDDLWDHIKHPIGMGIGIVSQFGLMPLAAFSVLLASGVAGVHATGVLIIACCPGGTLSNTFTYLSGGDLPLSVAMTTASTVLATGMLPGNLWLYGRYFESVDFVIPYKKMAVSNLIVTSPICVGMILKLKVPRIAKWVTKIGVYTGLLIILVNIVLVLVIFPNLFTSVQPRLYVIIFLLPSLGLALGWGFAALFRQKVPVCKTIAIECGIQNVPLSLTVISLSFALEMQNDIILLPWLYLFGMVIGSTILSGCYQLHKRLAQRKTIKDLGFPNSKGGDAENPEKEDLMKTKNQDIELESKIILSNGHSPRQRNMSI